MLISIDYVDTYKSTSWLAHKMLVMVRMGIDRFVALLRRKNFLLRQHTILKTVIEKRQLIWFQKS
jgi:hypothetical protein